MTDTNFMIERRLAELNPKYSEIFKNAIFIMNTTLDRNTKYFPNFTDHTLRHVTFVLEFCNKLIGEENIEKLNEDELLILAISCVLHDIGMTITDEDYEKYCKLVVPEDYLNSHKENDIRETIRFYHQDFGAFLVEKYASLFEIPSEKHAYCIAQTVRGHRKADLLDLENFDPEYKLDNGNNVCLPYLAALIRLADELDIAEDRNPTEAYLEHAGLIHFRKHKAIKHLEFDEDSFNLLVQDSDKEVIAFCDEEIENLKDILKYVRVIIEKLTPFSLKYKYVISKHILEEKEKVIVLDTDAGTDDAIAISLLNQMGGFSPNYIIASPGNASLDQSSTNVCLMKHLFGLKATIVKGICGEDVLNKTEKDTFHGGDGFANTSDSIIKKYNLSKVITHEEMSFNDLTKILESNKEIMYITIGPLATLDHLLKNEKIRSNLSHLYIMGGGFKETNCSHNSEFNFSKDPTALKNILSSRIPITLFPLDLTNHQVLTAKDIDNLERRNAIPEAIDLLRWNLNANCKYNKINGAVLHDTMPILYLCSKDKFKTDIRKINSDSYGSTFENENGFEVEIATDVEHSFFEDAISKSLLQK